MPDRDPAQNEETAFAVPRTPGHHDPVALPRPLSASDAAAVRDILRAQRQGDFDTAVARSKTLKDDTLLGDILADRYLNPGYHPEPAQLRAWLKTYSSLADAGAIQARLIAISPRGSVAPQSFPTPLSPGVTEAPMVAESDPSSHLIARNPLLDRTVAERASWGGKGVLSALHLIDATPGMTDLYAGVLRTELALTLLTTGESGLAFDTASTAFSRSRQRLGRAAYVAGLAAWRDDRIQEASHFFEMASRAPLTSPAIHAGAAYWAARCQRRLDAPGNAAAWLHRASSSTGTFYGILAQQALGRHRSTSGNIFTADDEIALHDPIPVMGEIDVEAVAAAPQGRRLFALLQLGETDRAEALLRRLWPDIAADAALCHSVQLVAAAAGLHDLSEQIATLLAARDGRPADVAGFPVPRLSPRHGFRIDPALVYALTRLESNFDAAASSSAGAHGLMQIRPLTASFVTGPKPTFDTHGVAVINVPPNMVQRLHNPSVNLEIGQLYVLYLASIATHDDDRVDHGDLVHILAAYNAGPGAIQHWEKAAKDGALSDPLLFMETLPSQETRDYVQHALTYLWIYADKLDLPAPSLQRLARAEWPRFAEEQAIAGRDVTFH
ncbi:lytic murein transglycosylase [Neoasaia chiangmaiensis NBRC 101099]|nr:transglycosylase SLT domain-containing protein [Neoasaia chiangmaiensis]GBR37328.1 lytic murein transglycosylase [Neoasaia chiangmaiensis NBRC 101099]GEN14899.1 lytic transglycosylase [Neoasaia chiangmaiensis]